MSHDRVVCDPKIMMGKPVVRGTRITLEVILRLLGQGRAVEEIIDAYPGLTGEDIHAAQSFAADYLASGWALAAA